MPWFSNLFIQINYSIHNNIRLIIQMDHSNDKEEEELVPNI